MHVVNLLRRSLTLAIAIGGFTAQMSQAVQLRDGKIYFVQPPSLIAATTTYKEVNAWGATYYFTINLPENAGESLQKVTITQREGVENIHYNLKDTRAFGETRDRKKIPLTLGPVTRESKTRSVSVTFDPPVTPGQKITIGLRPIKNPSFSGVYLLGVTAFPVGEKSHGQFIGFGRLHFYGYGRYWFP
ncbi:MAG: DUF2808 domain-containing protein [Desmonostoc vinosum HA7617-LM4]|jgi:hypothetical protein|nr:DUF2808 domain-containing protein [Desmonostoc vinosum HA7617-LM4]